MDVLMSLINMLLVPFIGVALHYKRKGLQMNQNAKLLAHYAVFVVCNILIVHFFTMLINRAIGADIGAQSVAYTMIALITTCCLPYVIQVLQKYLQLKFEVEERVDKQE